MLSLRQDGLGRAALNDYRLGQMLEALFTAPLNRVFGAIALNALEVYALSTPWLHQDTTTITLYGACLSTWGLLLLKCQHVGAITGLPLGGNDHVAGHDFCPLCQGAPDLCDGPSCLRAASGCATLG